MEKTVNFEYVLSLLKHEIHKHPKEYQAEVDFVIKILTEGQGYLTKRTKTEPYCKVVFYDMLVNK